MHTGVLACLAVLFADVHVSAKSKFAGWPEDLSSKYTAVKGFGRGSSKGAFLVKRHEDDEKMILVVRKNGIRGAGVILGQTFPLSRQCGYMRWMQYETCNPDHPREDIRRMQASYIPNCIDFGNTSAGHEYLVTLAGRQKLYGFINNATEQERLRGLAQLVAAAYSLHSVGLSHNDLTNNNIVVDAGHISFIDLESLRLGRCRKGPEKCITPVQHDERRLWKYVAKFAGCDKKSEDGNVLNTQKECMRRHWSLDEKTSSALMEMRKNVTNILPQLSTLMQSRLVSDNLGEFDERYRIPELNGCENWSRADFVRKKREAGVVDPPLR